MLLEKPHNDIYSNRNRKLEFKQRMHQSLITAFIHNRRQWSEKLIVGGYYSREFPLASLNSYNELKICLVNKGLVQLADGQQMELDRIDFSRGPRTSSCLKKLVVYSSLWPHPYSPLMQGQMRVGKNRNLHNDSTFILFTIYSCLFTDTEAVEISFVYF